jgi:cold shock CspA family protein
MNSLVSRLSSTRSLFARTSVVSAVRLFTLTREPGAAVLRGHVKWFDVKKGYGFIEPADGSDPVFVHQSNIYAQGFRSLGDGEAVEFETQVTSGKVSAKLVSGPEGAFVRGAPRPPPRASDRGSDRQERSTRTDERPRWE